MEERSTYGTFSQTPVSQVKDSMGLTAEQRRYAWIALAAGVLALVWWLMRSPDTANTYNNAADTEQSERTRSSNSNDR